MSAVLDYFRQKDSRFEGVPDDRLTQFIGMKHPKFLLDAEFGAAFQRARPSESLTPSAAAPFAATQAVVVPEDQLRAKAVEAEQLRQTFEASLSFAANDPVKRAALTAAHKQAATERGVTVLDRTEMETLRTPVQEVPRLTGEEVQALTGLGPTSAKVVAGVEQAAAGLTEFFLTPLGLTTLGLGAAPGVVQRNVSALFAADMLSSMPQQAAELYDAFMAKDVERTTASLVGLGITPVFVRGALRHATPEYAAAKMQSQVMLDQARQTATLLADPRIAGLPASPKEIAQLAVRRGVRVVDSMPPRPVDWREPVVTETWWNDLWTPGSPTSVKQDVGTGRLGWQRTADELAMPLGAKPGRVFEEPVAEPTGLTPVRGDVDLTPKPVELVYDTPPGEAAAIQRAEQGARTVEEAAAAPVLPQGLEEIRFSPEWRDTEGTRRLTEDLPRLSNEQLLSLYAASGELSPTEFGKAFALEAQRRGVELTPEQVSKPTEYKHGAQAWSSTVHLDAFTELYKRGLLNEAKQWAKENPVPLEERIQRLVEWPPAAPTEARIAPTATPSPQALGIVPPGTQAAIAVATKFRDFFRKDVSPGEEMPFTFSDTPLPRYQPYENLRATVTKPFGIGRIGVVGRVFDPRHRSGDPILGAVIVNAYGKEMGNNVSKIIGAELAFADKEFKGLPISDVVEAYLRDPESVTLSETQVRAIGIAKMYLDDALAMMAEADIPRAEALKLFVEGAEDGTVGYFPRTWLGKVNLPGAQGEARGLGLSTKPGSLKGRKIPTEAEGREAGHIYEENFSARVANNVQKAYHAVTNKRFVEDPALGGETIQSRMEQLAEANFRELDILKASVGRAETSAQAKARYERYRDVYDELKKDYPDIFQNFKDQVQPTAAEGVTVHPALRGMIFDRATLAKLNEWLTPTKHKYLDMISKVNAASKGAQLALDNSAPLVQGLPLLFLAPNIWAKAMGANLRAWRRPEYLEHELVKPEIREAAMQLAQLGTSFRVLNDYMAGVKKGSFLETRPIIGGLFNRAGGAFGAFVDLGKIHLWMAVRDNVPKRDWFRTAEAIDNILGSARGKNIGKSVARLEMSQNLMLAPSYYMSGLNLVAGLTAKGATGSLVRKAVGHFAGGIMLTTFAGWLASGMSWDDMEEKAKRMDFTVPVKLWGDKTVNVGFTHILLSLAKASAATFRAAADKRTPLLSNRWRENALMQGDPTQNPIMRWFWGHSAPLPALAIDLVKDYDFLGQDTDIPQSLLKRIQPLWLQQIAQTLDENKPGFLPVIGDALASGMGLNAYPQNYQQLYKAKANEESQTQFKRDYDQLSVQEQLRVTKVISKLPEIANKPPASKIAREQATKWESLRRQRMTEGLSPEAAAPLSKHGLHLTTFEPRLALGGEQIYLTGDQQDQLEALIVQEYDKILPRVTKQLDALSPFKKQDFLNDVLGDAKARAKALFVKASVAKARAVQAERSK